jgi:hypothetical protein
MTSVFRGAIERSRPLHKGVGMFRTAPVSDGTVQ